MFWSNLKKIKNSPSKYNYVLGGTDILRLAKSEIELPRGERFLCVQGYVFTPWEGNSESSEASLCSQTVLIFGHVLRLCFTQSDVLCPTVQSDRETGML